MRKFPLITGGIYHVFTKSISNFKIFNNDSDYLRIISELVYYNSVENKLKLSRFFLLNPDIGFKDVISNFYFAKIRFVDIISYCIMPTHLHFAFKQNIDEGISHLMNNLLNSYTRYFNRKHNRKGPLWEARFKNIAIEKDEQLLHLTRYHHLNPVTAYMVEKPEEWVYSSYREYIGLTDLKLCSYSDLLNLNSKKYKEFVEDRIGYQRTLAKIKNDILE